MESYLDIDFLDSKVIKTSDKERIANLLANVESKAATSLTTEKGIIVATKPFDETESKIIYAIPASVLWP